MASGGTREKLSDQPWLKLDDESEVAFQAFSTYLGLSINEKSLSVAAKRLSKTKQVLQKWATTFHWRERDTAWTNHKEQAKRNAETETVAAMQKRHIQAAMLLQAIALKEATKILRESEQRSQVAVAEGKKDKASLSPDQVTRLLDLATRLERLNRGEPDSVSEHRVTDDRHAHLRAATAEELERRARAALEAIARARAREAPRELKVVEGGKLTG